MQTHLLAPMITLVLWTFVMWVWLYATRIPAIRRLHVPLDADQSKEAFNAQLPPHVRWKADNYNHLLEQPVLFYAVVLALCTAPAGTPVGQAIVVDGRPPVIAT